MGAFAEFERSLIKERQLEGIALAKREKKYRGRKPVLNESYIRELHRMAEDGKKKSELAKYFGISRETVYKYLAVSSDELTPAC